MTSMNLKSVDLNLLVAFDALMSERSVSRAAAKLGITQSALSHALKRLRVCSAILLCSAGREVWSRPSGRYRSSSR